MKPLFLILITILVFSFPIAAQRSVVVDVPMSFYGNRPAIEIMVNGKGPFLFLIDTGAQGMARADTSLVQRLELRTVGQTTSSDASAKTQATLNEVRLETVSIGNLQFRDVTAYSRNYNTASYLAHIDGILGFDLFSDYLLTLDYPNKRVRIERGELSKPDGVQILNLETIDGNQYVEIGIGALKTKAMIDSGNIRAVDFPASFVKKLPLASYPKLIGKGGSVSGEFELKEVRLQDTLSIGRYLFPEPTITFTDVQEEINIGSAMLREFAITFDQKNHRVRFIRSRDKMKR
jgi:Aspartyl protease